MEIITATASVVNTIPTMSYMEAINLALKILIIGAPFIILVLTYELLKKKLKIK